MTAKKFATIEKELLPYLPGFVIQKKLMLVPPVGDILRGVYFENSSGTADFYVRVLFLSLFVPHEHIDFLHGKRLRRKGELWHSDEPNLIENLNEKIQEQAIPFLESVSTLAGVLKVMEAEVKSCWPRFNSHHMEELAYALIKNGEYPAALEWLVYLKRHLENATTLWVVAQRNRAELIEEKLLQSTETALEQLDTWKAETIHNLGLEKYC